MTHSFSWATSSYGPEPSADRAPARPMGRMEFNRRLQSAPRFRYRPPTDTELNAVVNAYEALSGKQSSRRVIDLLAACWRVHGPLTVERLSILHTERGTTTNLLGELRLSAPSSFADADLRRSP